MMARGDERDYEDSMGSVGLANKSLRVRARTAGFLYLLIILGALFIPFAVAPSGISGMTLVEAALSDVARIRDSAPLFVLSGAAQLLILACDIVVAILFYDLFKPISNTLSLLAASFRLTFVAIAGANLFNHFALLNLLSGAPYLQAVEPDKLLALAVAFFKLRTLGFDIALVFFGCHCALLGWLIFKSTFLPRTLGLLLSIGGGVGYLANIFSHALAPELRSTVFPIMMMPAGAAELLLALWLIVVGVNVPKWEALAEGPQTMRMNDAFDSMDAL